MTSDDHKPRPRRRRLRDEERALWGTVTRSIAPLKSRPPIESPDVSEPAESPQPPLPSAAAAPGLPAKGKERAQKPLAPLGKRLRQRLARGSEAIERRIDLHGHTQRQAHTALARFLRLSQIEGARIVLVITGKGVRGDTDPFAERGVLRRQVPMWLKEAALRDLVVGFEPANIGHGGEGALYVRLRRPKGQG